METFTALLLTAFAIFLLILYLRQRISAAAVKPVGKDGVMLAERLSEKKRYVMLKEKYGVQIGIAIALCGVAVGCGVCRGLGL